MNQIHIAALAICMAFAACSTTPVGNRATPAAETVKSALMSPSPRSGELFISRDSGLLGSGCNHLVRLDGKLLGELRAGEQLAAFPQPGEHILEVRTGGYFCKEGLGGAVVLQTIEGKRLTYRTGMKGAATVIIELVP